MQDFSMLKWRETREPVWLRCDHIGEADAPLRFFDDFVVRFTLNNNVHVLFVGKDCVDMVNKLLLTEIVADYGNDLLVRTASRITHRGFKSTGEARRAGFGFSPRLTMILSDSEIARAIEDGELKFIPAILPEQIQTSSIDLRLGYNLTTFPPQPSGVRIAVDLSAGVNVEEVFSLYGKTKELQLNEEYTLEPGTFVLGYTLEYMELSAGLAARVEGRSTLGRLGISIHQTAPTVHAKFKDACVWRCPPMGHLVAY